MNMAGRPDEGQGIPSKTRGSLLGFFEVFTVSASSGHKLE